MINDGKIRNSAYLSESHYIDWKDGRILQKAEQLLAISMNHIDLMKQTYHYVRDQIRHSWDARDSLVTVTASDVIREGTGICYAKANLLAALLRANHIPAGICYQRLTLGDTPDTGYCVHALNAVYLADLDKWIRIDARGNKPGVEAEFIPGQERLAFSIRPELGEIDYPEIYPEPLPITMEVLESSTDAIAMCMHSLPSAL